MGGIWGECSGKRRNAAKCGSIAPQSATMEPLVSKTTVRRTGWAVLRAGAAGCWPHCYGIAASAGGATSATRCARRLKASSGRWLYRADVASFLPPRCFFYIFSMHFRRLCCTLAWGLVSAVVAALPACTTTPRVAGTTPTTIHPSPPLPTVYTIGTRNSPRANAPKTAPYDTFADRRNTGQDGLQYFHVVHISLVNRHAHRHPVRHLQPQLLRVALAAVARVGAGFFRPTALCARNHRPPATSSPDPAHHHTPATPAPKVEQKHFDRPTPETACAPSS